MFPSPPKTLHHSLSNALTGAQRHKGDVCFLFNNEQQLWAHKALLIARAPKECVLKMMPQLLDDNNTDKDLITISDLSTRIPYTAFVHLLRFWYTADFLSPKTSSSSPTPSIVSSLSSSSNTFSSSSSPTERVSPTAPCTERLSDIHQSITTLEQKLKIQLLPQTTEGLSDDDQLAADLACMRRNQLNCDITVNIYKPSITTSIATTNRKKSQALKPKLTSTPSPTLIQRHPTPANTTSTASAKSDPITSILNTTPSSPTSKTDDIDDDRDLDENNSSTVAPSPSLSSSATMISFPVHRCILASRSSYFHSLLSDQQAHDIPSSSTVLLPSDLFSSMTLDIILHYFYTDQLQVPDLPHSETTTATSNTMSVFQREMNRKKHLLRELQKVFRAADYLGLIDSLCKAALHEMESICHRFQCTCSSCVVLLPSMLAFANKHQQQLPLLRSKLMELYTDPIQALSPLWSQKPFSLFIVAHLATVDGDTDGGNMFILPSSLQSLFFHSNNSNNDSGHLSTTTHSTQITPSSSTSSVSPYPAAATAATAVTSAATSSSLLAELVSMTLENITKRNAIHVLHSVHLCLSKIRSADPLPTWSQASLTLIHAFLHHTLAMVSQDFNYYCVDYPILLSCVDGIGGGFSVDFLEFLLKRLLDNGIQDSNAAVLYQGIVRDLIGRQQVVKNVAVDGVLLDARRQCVEYLSHRWIGVQAQGGFQCIDKDILRLMAEDINVPYRTISKPMESEFSAMFGFKPKSSSSTNKQQHKFLGSTDDLGFKNGTATTVLDTPPSSKSRRRLSLGSLRYPRSSKSSINRRSATEVRDWIDSPASEEDMHSLSDNETIARSSQHSFHRHLSLQQQQQQQRTAHPTMTRRGSSASLTDVLLPVDMSVSNVPPLTTTSSPHHRNKTTRRNSANTTTAMSTSPPLTGKLPRKSRLTFELPETPIRTKLSIKGSTSGRTSSSKHKYRWGGLKTGFKESGSDSGDDDDDQTVVVVGAKVELLRRPLPTLGRIKYIGHVEFSKGTWVGVELESRLGQNDGSVDGVRYFQTDPQRGIFVKSDGFKLISGPSKP
ncbi:hypothetical protein BCR42DRAFT_353419 [Absidia repens]|uniref:CAP-Gly domain-containing protein n=1 Tax=Absidia repens TaxID=90262 RepID=A0A1X2IEV1_9FUNG|nr:hypothetical protein BCR42DRAFT_353419 [Absidia repens]